MYNIRSVWTLDDPIYNIIDRIEPSHVLFLQVIYRVAFAFRKHSYENVCAGHLLTARGLDVNCRALQYALKARRRLCVVAVGSDEVAELIIDIVQDLAPQPVEVDGAGAQHSDRVLILGQREQQMFKGGVFVPALIGISERAMQSFLKGP